MSDTHRRRFILGSLTALGVLATIKPAQDAYAQETPTEAKKWTCPPCDCGEHDKTFPAPGKCPACDMELIEKT